MPPNRVRFNYTAAKAAGFTDEDIAQSLARKRAQGIPVYVDSTEVAAVRSQAAPKATEATPRGPIPYDVVRSAFKATSPSITIPPLSSFSALGGIAGGLAGLPIGQPITGAMIGGGIGRAGELGLSGQPISLRAVARSGAEQGAYQAMGMGIGKLASSIGPMAKGTAAMMRNPAARAVSHVGRLGLPVGGALSHGIPGALAGAALPYLGRGAMKIATSPITEALLNSPAFQRLARQSPRLARELWDQMMGPAAPDATAP
jgi:hypothetical protein